MLDYILRHGSERVIEDAKDHLREIKKLQKFEYVDPDGKDQGVNEALNAERDKARATRNKYGGGFSDEDFKYAADRDRRSSGSDPVMGLTSLVGGLVSSATEYASAASKQLQSMQTLFPSNELDRKLTDCLSNDQQMPSSSLLYELGRATHREDDYRIILSAIWQNVLQSFSSTDFNEAGKVQAKANDIIELLDNSSNLQKKRRESADSVAGKFVGISSSDKPAKRDEAPKREEWAPDDGFGAAFDALKSNDPAPAPSNVNLFDPGAPMGGMGGMGGMRPMGGMAPMGGMGGGMGQPMGGMGSVPMGGGMGGGEPPSLQRSTVWSLPSTSLEPLP
ncbi:hypothetical protein EMIHUDRAFT_209558 [Emiliania huxleyi CCMP1516]|uniref:ENTH domain-containing protein n=2 Tax=Emiliania huxleyi TaxID=2903 RepID=A0A0D3J5X2_EMIH1|nr:hypothetical protein EMIHUDRAFT_209558 [Emiliania huxleyi CCMP1516]EOD18907.1 hypothetical protein EMIHUDRAFT_209558 [Emiliania huxleyi CCMP1516]|eukprot:XP_005771336.1 hypothetical protein EMIHUDRAFT_209558 [Emiliania huxleyi CCMP1516]